MIYYYSERQLSPFEQMRAHKQIDKRTRAMKFAFDIMPQSMKASVELDQALPFNRIAYYPDILFHLFLFYIELFLFISLKSIICFVPLHHGSR